MKLTQIALVAFLGAAVAAPVFAQPGPGMGARAGKAMRYAFNKDNTPGWSLMSAEERSAYHDKMLAAKSYDECKALQDEQHQAMAARAKEQGKTLRGPRRNACDNMKARGFFK
ncbi:hypothetical protein GALL_182300 [mine drainage metagenome]|uniref:Uncharacterized protein n=1 Tax=mine drainage metagenome TaxID=410659 RepID=A0A1J5SD63_9ZZZZ